MKKKNQYKIAEAHLKSNVLLNFEITGMVECYLVVCFINRNHFRESTCLVMSEMLSVESSI